MTTVPDDQSTPKHSTEETTADPQPVSAASHASSTQQHDDSAGVRDFGYVGEADEPPREHEASLLHRITEVGDDAVKKLKDIFSEIDREEVKRNMNREHIQRSVASAFDSLNTKVQEMLAPKGDKKDGEHPSPHADPFVAPSATGASPSSTEPPTAPGPVGTEAVQPETTGDPFLRNPEDRPDASRGF
jgi:hypothetical protein